MAASSIFKRAGPPGFALPLGPVMTMEIPTPLADPQKPDPQKPLPALQQN
jgi:hypothetical protein